MSKRSSEVPEEEVEEESRKPKLARQIFSGEKKRLVVVLEQASLEIVKTGKEHQLLTCDRHKSLMRKLGREPGDARPDIAHQSLLMLMDSPLNKAGLLEVYIHTAQNVLIHIHPQTRIPRTFDRFCGLMVQLLHKLAVKAPEGGIKLLQVVKNPVTRYLPLGAKKFACSFHAGGPERPVTLIPKDESVVFVIGAMAHGSISPDFTEQTVSFSSYPLSAALTCSKLCSAVEEVWGVL